MLGLWSQRDLGSDLGFTTYYLDKYFGKVFNILGPWFLICKNGSKDTYLAALLKDMLILCVQCN